MSLTDEGRIILEQGLPLIHQFENLVEQLSQSHDQLTGTLKVTASATFGTHILTTVIAEFLKIHPQLKLSLDLNDQNIDIVAQNMDIAIRIGELHDSNLVARPILSNPRLLCASPEYLEKFGMPLNLQDLIQHQCIIQNHQQGLTRIWHFIDQYQRRIDIKIDGKFICNSGEGIRQAALAGLGISNHSMWHVADDLKTGQLIEVLPNFQVQATQIYAVIPNRKLIPHKVNVFIHFVKQYFEDNPIY